MPNWIYNTIQIAGEKTDLDAIKEKLAKPYHTYFWNYADKKPKEEKVEAPFLLWNIISPDPEIHDTYFSNNNQEQNNWYNWNITNWGTKWEVSESEISSFEDDTYLTYIFDSAWDAPTPALEKLSEQFPKVTITLEIDGETDVKGTLVFQNGKIITNELYEDEDEDDEDNFDEDDE